MGAEQGCFIIPFDELVFITTSPLRIKQVRKNGTPGNYYSNGNFNRAITNAEESIDRRLEIGLLTEIPSYPIFPAVAKALGAIQCLNTVNDDERNNGRRFSDDQIFAVVDSTWVIGGRYFNKPTSYPSGSVAGVREVYNQLIRSAGNPVRNETVLVIFTKKGIEEIYLFSLEMGKVIDDIGNTGRKKTTMKMLFSGRKNVSAGIDSSEGAGNEIFDHYEQMPLTTFRITFPDGIFDSFDHIDPNHFLSAIEINKIGERRIPFFDKNLIMQALLGTFSPGFSLDGN